MPTEIKPAIPLACSDFSFLSLRHEVALDVIAGLGFDGVDVSLMTGYSHLEVPDVPRSPEEWGLRVAGLLHARGMVAADVNFLPGGDFTNLAVNHPDAGQRAGAADSFRRGIF